MFDVGDKVVYPHHGAGTVEKKEVKVVLGEEREYLTIRILHNCLLYTSPSPRDLSTSRMPSSA